MYRSGLYQVQLVKNKGYDRYQIILLICGIQTSKAFNKARFKKIHVPKLQRGEVERIQWTMERYWYFDSSRNVVNMFYLI